MKKNFKLAAFVCLSGLCSAAQATTINKTNNVNNLNLGSSWVGGAAPGSNDVAQWSNTVTGANTVSLGADLKWAGIKVVNPGGLVTLNAGNTLTLGSSGLDLSAATQDLTLNCALSLVSNQIWNVANGRTVFISNSVSGTALLTLPGSGTVTFNGGSGATYTLGTSSGPNNALAMNAGTVNFQSGTLTLGSNNSGGNHSDAAQINGNSTFNLSGGTVNSSFYIRLGSGATGTLSTLNVSGGTFNNTGEILCGLGGTGGSGTLTISGGVVNAHYLRLGETSTNGTHTVNLDGGTLKADRIYRSNATPVFNFNGGQLVVNASPQTPWFASSVSNVFVKNGGAIIDTAGANVTIEPNIQPFSGSTGGLSKLGAGTLTLSGTNTYDGSTVVREGILCLTGTNSLPGWAVAGRYMVSNSAVLTVLNTVADDDVTAILGSGNFAAGSGFGFDTTAGNRTNSSLIANTTNGPLGLIKAGANTLTLTGTNTYSGGTTVMAGTLTVTNGGKIGVSGTLAVLTGTTLDLNGTTQTVSAVTIAGGTITGGKLIGSSFDWQSGTVSAMLAGSGAVLTKSGPGTLTMTNSGSTYSGGTVVNGGVLSTGGIDNPLGTGAVTLNDGTSFSLAAGTVSNSIIIPAGQNVVMDGNATLSGPISGSGSLTHGGAGAYNLALLANNSGFSGSITNAAVISIKNKNSLGTGTLYMNNGTNSALAAKAALIGYDAIANNIVLLNTAKLGATSCTGDFELKGVLSGPGGLTANHPSVTVTLSGANTYTGVTTIALGGLIINGSLQSPLLTAASGTVLSGTGTVQAAVMNSGATLKIGGTTPGTMNFNGDLTLASGSTNVMKVFSTNSYDVLRGAGTNVLSAGGTIVLDFSSDVTIDAGDQFNVTQIYQNWSNVTQGAGLNFIATGLPGSFVMDASTVASNGLVTIVPVNVSPITLPELYPIAMTYHGPTVGTNTIADELVKYQNIEIIGGVASGVWDATRTTYPNKIVLKQSAWGSDIETPNKLDIYPGHLLLKTGTKLSANVSATSTVFYVDDYKVIAANQGVIDRDNADGKPLYVLIYKLDGSGNPDWSQTEHAVVTAINPDHSFVLTRAQFGGTPLAFESGKTVVAKHMLFWSGQWQLNFSLQCPRGGPLNLTAAEWFAREVKRTVDESGADGVEFDVARWGCSPAWGTMDCNNDLVTDYGYIDGVQSFGLGGQVFLKELRKLLGPGKIIQHDGNSTGMQRGRKYVNGVQMESFPNANDYSTFSEAFLHFRHWAEDVETLPKFSYGYVKTVTTTFAHMTDTDGSDLDWHFRVGFASGLLAGMPSPFTSITDPNFIPDQDVNTNVTSEGSGGAIFKWDEYVGGDLNNWQWLGKPLGAAVQVLDNVGSSNLLASTVWRWKVETDFSATCLTNSGEFSSVMTALASPTNVVPGSSDHFTSTQIPKTPAFGVRLEINSGAPVLLTNQEYTIEFEACGNDNWNYAGQSFDKVPRALSILTPQNDTTLDVLISSNWVPYRMSFFVTTNSPLTFGFSEQIGNASVRNIKLYQGGAERWTREFEHGRIYLNMTKTPWAVNVGTGAVQRLVGTQATNINSGVAENGTLTVPVWDAVYLRTWTVDAWKSAYFTSNQLTNAAVSGDSADPDGDGFSNYQEYIAGTNPTNAASKFSVAGGIDRTKLNWSSVSGRVYDVYWSTNLLNAFVPLQTNIAWPQSSYTNPPPGGAGSGFYKMKVRRP